MSPVAYILLVVVGAVVLAALVDTGVRIARRR